MVDISYAGAKVYLSTRSGDKVGPITEFSDEGSPVEIPDIDIADGNMNLNGILIGIVVLCLSQFFAYGTQLQEDNDGLV